MARGDGTFSRLDVDIWTTRSMLSLKAGAKLFYIMVWTVAVRERKSFLEIDFIHKLSRLFIGCVRKSSATYLKSILEAGLGKETEDGHLYIYGVKDCHEKLNWRDDGLFSPQSPLYRDVKDPAADPISGDTRRNDTRQDHKNKDEKRNVERSSEGDRGNGGDQGKDLQQIGGTIAGILDQTLQESKTTRMNLLEEIMRNLALPEKEREPVLRIINKFEGSLEIVADAMVCVVEGMSRHREGTGAAVRSPMALLNYHVKRIERDRA